MIRTRSRVLPLLSLVPLAAATVALLVFPTGCGPIGCFDAAQTNGTCPPPNEALAQFGDPACGGLVQSVDSEASLRKDEQTGRNMCCYAITNKEPDYSATCTYE